MNKFVSPALAGAVALSALTASASLASADGWHRRPYYYYRPAPTYDAGPALLAGTMFGLALGTLVQPTYPAYAAYPPPPPPPYYPAYRGNPHFDWCTAHYESYNGETDTWTDYRGVPHRCIGPY